MNEPDDLFTNLNKAWWIFREREVLRLLVPTINSFTLFERLPNARLSLYPDAGHGGLFQYGETFVAEGVRFLHE